MEQKSNKTMFAGFVAAAAIGVATFCDTLLPDKSPIKAFEPTIGADGPVVKGLSPDKVIGSGPTGP